MTNPAQTMLELALAKCEDYFRIHGEHRPLTGKTLSPKHKARATLYNVMELLRDAAAATVQGAGEPVAWISPETLAELHGPKCGAALHRISPIAVKGYDIALYAHPSSDRPASAPVAGEPVAWRVLLSDGSCTAWFDGKPPDYLGPYEYAYARPASEDRDWSGMTTYPIAPSEARPASAMPHVVLEVLKEIVAADQQEKFVTIKTDPAGNTMAVEIVDGPCARIARRALAAIPQKQDASPNG